MNYIRSALFFTMMFIAGIVYMIACPCALSSERISRKVTMLWLKSIMISCRICGIKIKLHNDIFKNTKGVIIASNHCSAWETFFISHYYNVPIFVLKKSLFNIPLLGLFLYKFKMIGIDRTSYSKKIQEKIVTNANEVLKAGSNIVIFPQGTRVPINQSFDYKKYPYKPGVAMFAGGQKIVTISTDASKCFGRGMFSWKKSGTINVVFNEILEIKHNETKEDISRMIRDSIEIGLKKVV